MPCSSSTRWLPPAWCKLIGEYTGAEKEIRPVTLTIYQMLTHRRSRQEGFTHLDLLRRNDWGLIIYDEVHLLPSRAIDLPDASMAVQVSGTYGSRQEEAQRLGRILRPKSRSSRFYSLVSKETREQNFAARRQLFLVEQGYRYRILDWEDNT